MRGLPGALRRLPIGLRLAGTSAVLTFVILLAFATIVGTLTTRRIRADFNERVSAVAVDLGRRVDLAPRGPNGSLACVPDLGLFAAAEVAVIRLVTVRGEPLCETPNAPDLGPPQLEPVQRGGLRIATAGGPSLAGGVPTFVQYARPTSSVERTVARVRLFLLVGVVGGAAFALMAGLAIARRAMAPIAELTATAREIARTRDPARGRVPVPEAEDEVAELARTFEDMLGALDDAREETEGALRRQREFVADASHELRTPLTSLLANLELLAEEVDGEPRATTEAALRSTQRMRRLVADLLLLARADAGRGPRREPTDLARVVVEAVAELEPLAARSGHRVTVATEPVVVRGARDELHRAVVNLVGNALTHTPGGTHVRVGLTAGDRGAAELVVEDDGPGVDPVLRDRLFDRFVRGAGDRGGSSGLGLAIVRAVAEAHGGTAEAGDRPGGGARFVVRLPVGAPEPGEPAPTVVDRPLPAARPAD